MSSLIGRRQGSWRMTSMKSRGHCTCNINMIKYRSILPFPLNQFCIGSKEVRSTHSSNTVGGACLVHCVEMCTELCIIDVEFFKSCVCIKHYYDQNYVFSPPLSLPPLSPPLSSLSIFISRSCTFLNISTSLVLHYTSVPYWLTRQIMPLMKQQHQQAETITVPNSL